MNNIVKTTIADFSTCYKVNALGRVYHKRKRKSPQFRYRGYNRTIMQTPTPTPLLAQICKYTSANPMQLNS